MLSFHVVNLIIPEEPQGLILDLPSGGWTLSQHPRYAEFKEAVDRGQCAETYFIDHPADVPSAADQAIEELTPILLAASYLTGQSVTIKRSTIGSDALILQASEHWPRERMMDLDSAVINSTAELKDLMERFVSVWAHAGQTEKVLLLVHHWLDSRSCWSMEDLYLSATTLLQVIAQTEKSRLGNDRLTFFQSIQDAADHYSIRRLSQNFKDMWNELIHEGRLKVRGFPGPDKAACAAVVADVLNWFDEYVHASLGLGAPRRIRFRAGDLMRLNAYSIS